MSAIRPVIFVCLVILSVFFGYLVYDKFFSGSEPYEDKSVVTNNLLIEKIESIGKLELCKMYVKDIVEQKEIKNWYLPNSKVILIISGEATGCIDLTKIDSSTIEATTDVIRIKLPAPEICYIKINHQESKVYDIQNEYFDKAKLIDKAFAIAEKTIENSVIKMDILTLTKNNAITTLKPLLEQMTNKKVELYF